MPAPEATLSDRYMHATCPGCGLPKSSCWQCSIADVLVARVADAALATFVVVVLCPCLLWYFLICALTIVLGVAQIVSCAVGRPWNGIAAALNTARPLFLVCLPVGIVLGAWLWRRRRGFMRPRGHDETAGRMRP